MSFEERNDLDKLLLVFVHGFRGSDTSFKDFPNRLQAILSSTVKADVKAIVYPSYKTAGDLRVAVNNFSDWLCNEVYTLQNKIKPNSKGKVMIVLLGHSMGGIVSAETILGFHDNKKKNDQLLGAKIIGMIAYDTPFYSINENFVTDKAVSSFEQVNKELNRFWNTNNNAAASTAAAAAVTTRAITSGSSSGSNSMKKWGFFAGVAGAVALGAAAYIARDEISSTINEAYDHVTFISDLTNINGCDQRVRKLLDVPDIFFKCFYVQLSELGNNRKPKTFIKLPPADIAYLFVPVHSPADDEIHAHTSMFNPEKTDHYYELGSDSISLITEMVARFQRKKQDPAITNYPYYPPPSSSTTSNPALSSHTSNTSSFPHYPHPNHYNSSFSSS